MNYLMADGRELYVTDGFSEGRTWFTAYKAPTGSTRRYKSPDLPCRRTREEAQADLDSYARKKGLKARAAVMQTPKLGPRCTRIACIHNTGCIAGARLDHLCNMRCRLSDPPAKRNKMGGLDCLSERYETEVSPRHG